jgi:hypothetical protein
LFDLQFLSAFLFLLACAAWLVSITALIVVRAPRLERHRVRDMLVFMTVAALTTAIAATLFDDK